MTEPGTRTAVSQSAVTSLSVVVPTYNRCTLLGRCLIALRSQSGVSGPWEVIVVDDGSTDGTEDLCRHMAAEWPVLRYVRRHHCGPAAARNAGIKEARGEVVVFTDDDCVPPPDWLNRIQSWFVSDAELAGIGGIMVTPEKEWIPLSHRSDLVSPGEQGWSRFIGTNNAAYRRAVLMAAGGFDESFRHVSVEDAELYIRLLRAGHRLAIDPSLWVYHPARVERFWTAVRGYVRFWLGYRVLQTRYPAEFKQIYRSSPLSLVLSGRSWSLRLHRHLRGLLRHPWLGIKFAAYLAATRAVVLAGHGFIALRHLWRGRLWRARQPW